MPWNFDFQDEAVPITWVGARYRHQAREIDGDQAMVKVSTIPKGARSRAWMGHPDMHDYTVEADVRGDVMNNKMPDIGMIAQRYTLDLMGAYQKLQIRSWVPVMRMAKSVDFPWRKATFTIIKYISYINRTLEPSNCFRFARPPRPGQRPESENHNFSFVFPGIFGPKLDF